MEADLVAYDRNGQLALIVEVRKKTGTSTEWAAMLRRNILAHGTLPGTRFFLLAAPDRFYLWKDAGHYPEVIQPVFTIDAQPLLQPYLQAAGITLAELSGQAFELIVGSWLRDLLVSDTPPESRPEEQRWIFESGLLESIRDGRVEHEVSL